MDSNSILHASIGVTVEYTQGSKVSTLYKQQHINSTIATLSDDTINMQQENMACKYMKLK